MIICAAIKINGLNADFQEIDTVICGLRHSDCFKTIRFLQLLSKPEMVQGFINHKGEFLDRKEALAHARECGQLPETVRYYQEDHNIDELYSEDLY